MPKFEIKMKNWHGPQETPNQNLKKKTLYCNFKQVLCFSMQYEPKLYLLNCWKRYPLTEPPKQTISKNLLFVFSRFCRPKEKFREKSADALCVRLLWSRDGHRAKLSARKKSRESDQIGFFPIRSHYLPLGFFPIRWANFEMCFRSDHIFRLI